MSKNEQFAFITCYELPSIVSKSIHKNSELVFDENEIEILKVMTEDDKFAYIKFLDILDKTEITLIFSPSDKTALLWAEVIDGTSERGTTNIHYADSVDDVSLNLGFVKSTIASDERYSIEFSNHDKYTSDSIPDISSAWIADKDIQGDDKMTSSYRVIMDRNNNACIDEVTTGGNKSNSSMISILDKNKFVSELDMALARARIMGRNPNSVYKYTDGRNPEVIDSSNDAWEDSSQLIFKLASNSRYANEPMLRDIHTYFDDSEIAALHEDSKKEKEARRERYRRGAYQKGLIMTTVIQYSVSFVVFLVSLLAFAKLGKKVSVFSVLFSLVLGVVLGAGFFSYDKNEETFKSNTYDSVATVDYKDGRDKSVNLYKNDKQIFTHKCQVETKHKKKQDYKADTYTLTMSYPIISVYGMKFYPSNNGAKACKLTIVKYDE